MEDVRSLLFVPGDSERKITKAMDSAADVLILDLEDSVMPEKRRAARQLCRAALDGGGSKKLMVRINALDKPDALDDLAEVVGGRPYAIMLPKCRSVSDINLLHHYLTVLEVREGLEHGAIRVLPIVTETGASMFGLGTYKPGSPRLSGMLWGGEDLVADIGGTGNRDPSGRYAAPYELARSLCLYAAAAASVTAVDAVYTDFRSPEGLEAEAEIAVRDGFTAKAAIHPDQVSIINEVFTPKTEDVEHARRIVAIFEAGEGTSVASLDGRMLDRPHYTQAQRLLARAGIAP